MPDAYDYSRISGPWYTAGDGSADCGRSALPNLSLEDEILLLRSRMEQLYIQEQSLTADKVVRASGMLDLKINEYMRLRRK
ncbi:aspartyl-phosphate phosphatase Spo0E family protein [Paenibacillus spiritus]|uniref:Aspartyl-phosphate phosphatase Spo0E family protein n=1 Tax=Paenibacillus spiritus TaxID=2496557 RepID=A0A5J5GBL0_9BACL|nr:MULTISPECIES: aspartyl-phosphate phosphatase Spo0E family protein [Paenibacillus]KAA9005330.1 aspartyl-phosphate phosphatase Spo0E family protein [Paenibacillus spiritus]